MNLLDHELLLSHVIKKPREFIIAHPEYKLTKTQETRYKMLIKQRANGIPLAYLTKHKEFFGLDFLVNKYTLIPRPDTEVMMENVLERITYQRPKNKNQRIILIDVGTGSGCIPISIIKTLKHLNIQTFAIDNSKKALAMAHKNARKHNVKIKFLHGNLLEPSLKFCSMIHAPCSVIITANLPYLTAEQYRTNPDLKHEPKLALVAKNKGLYYYEKLLKQITKYSIFNIQYSIFLEIDPTQTSQIKSLINRYFPHTKIEIKKDLAGRNRVVIITK